jgi:hypothetical protein
MVRKRALVADRVRQVPRQFGWIDRRVLREGYIGRCETPALALYLLLVIVADAQGLSFYADAALERLLSMPVDTLGRARANLIRAGLIAYRAPLYQVLGLDPPLPPRKPGVQPVCATLERLQRQWRNAQVRA